jgi:acid phosphatase (class A)
MADPVPAQTPSPLGAAQPLITRDPTKLTFPRNYWDPTQRAFLPLVEFLQSDWDKRLKLDPPPSDRTQIEEEIRYLHSLIGQREQRRDEIKAQDEALEPYFHPILMMQPATHRRTGELLNFTHYMGAVGLVYKHRFNRARPSQLSPSLLPMITVAGHPAYPSGHGFQSWLAALVLAELRPDAREALLAMAQRIGLNREIAGVHYPSDTKAGQSLAAQAFEIVKPGKHFQELLAEAKAEWR